MVPNGKHWLDIFYGAANIDDKFENGAFVNKDAVGFRQSTVLYVGWRDSFFLGESQHTRMPYIGTRWSEREGLAYANETGHRLPIFQARFESRFSGRFDGFLIQSVAHRSTNRDARGGSIWLDDGADIYFSARI